MLDSVLDIALELLFIVLHRLKPAFHTSVLFLAGAFCAK